MPSKLATFSWIRTIPNFVLRFRLSILWFLRLQLLQIHFKTTSKRPKTNSNQFANPVRPVKCKPALENRQLCRWFRCDERPAHSRPSVWWSKFSKTMQFSSEKILRFHSFPNSLSEFPGVWASLLVNRLPIKFSMDSNGFQCIRQLAWWTSSIRQSPWRAESRSMS